MKIAIVLVVSLFYTCGPLKELIKNEDDEDDTSERVPLKATVISGTCAILEAGQLKCWGDNSVGQLGQGNTTNIGDKPGQMGDNLSSVELGSGRTVKSISSSTGFTCAILDNNELKCWGGNGRGALGQGNTDNIGDKPNQMGDNLKSIDLGTNKYALSTSANWSNVCAILNDNSLKCWGDGQFGETGQGSEFWIGDEPGQMGDNLPSIDLGTGRTAKQVSVGRQHVCALLDNGTVKCWGYKGLGQGIDTEIGNRPNQMGDNLKSIDLGSELQVTMIATGISHSCALFSDGTVKCWGINTYGQLGLGNTNHVGEEPGQMGDALASVDLGTGKKAKKIFAGSFHTCAILDDNSLVCWGRVLIDVADPSFENIGDEPNEMGDNLTKVDLGSDNYATDVSISSNNVCALLNDQSVKCWGRGSEGGHGQEHSDFISQKNDQLGDNLSSINLGTKAVEE